METVTTDYTALIWLVVSAVFFMLEVSLVPGIGFFFAGLAAITVGGMINFGHIESAAYFEQFAYFFGLIFAWAAVLWYPLKKFHKNSENNDFQNVIGDSAIVESNVLDKKKAGNVKWSGTITKARLYQEDEKDSVNKGDEVFVKEVKGNVLTVTTDIENTKTTKGE